MWLETSSLHMTGYTNILYVYDNFCGIMCAHRYDLDTKNPQGLHVLTNYVSCTQHFLYKCMLCFVHRHDVLTMSSYSNALS